MGSFLFIAIFIGLSVVYTLYMKKRGEDQMKNIDYSKELQHVESNIKSFVNGDFSEIKTWMKDKPINAFTSASVPVTDTDNAKNMATDALKSVAWSAVGVKARYNRVDTLSYLVLSGEDLHYLDSDVDGNLMAHLVFNPSDLVNAKIKNAGGKSVSIMMKDKSTEVYTLSLPSKDGAIEVNAHDGLDFQHKVGVGDMFGGKMVENTTKGKAVSEDFFKKLAEKYPNLKVNLKEKEHYKS